MSRVLEVSCLRSFWTLGTSTSTKALRCCRIWFSTSTSSCNVSIAITPSASPHTWNACLDPRTQLYATYTYTLYLCFLEQPRGSVFTVGWLTLTAMCTWWYNAIRDFSVLAWKTWCTSQYFLPRYYKQLVRRHSIETEWTQMLQVGGGGIP